MSWGFMRGSAWRFLQSPQYNRSASRGSISASNIFFDELQENVSSADGSTSGDEDLDSLVLFGMLRGNVVGLRYYTGVVNNNEMVALQREPGNPYDRNAVKVNNVNGEQVGHIKKELAAALAQIMDRKLVRIEGVVPYGAHNAFTMPVNLSFWGQEESKKVVLDHMKKYGYKLEPVPKNFGTSFMSQGAGSSHSPPLPAVRLTVDQLKSEFDKLFEDLKEDDKTQELEPAKSIQTVLLPHQKQALAWMASRENSTELPLFWEQRNNLYYNTLTNFAEKRRPESVRGGILADDMGLGKTLSMIALILTNFHDGQPLPTKKVKSGKQNIPNKSLTSDSDKPSRNKASQGLCSETNEIGNSQEAKGTSSERRKPRKAKCGFSDSEEEWLPRKTKSSPACSLVDDDQFAMALSGASSGVKKKSKKKVIETTVQDHSKCGKNLPRPTLIICPLSVMSNWIDQFEQHVQAEVDLNIYVYYGPERSRDQKTLSQQDVVLTSYSTVAYDYGPNSPLHKIKWLRVVLDEGHTIRNPSAQQTIAIHSLDAVRRWVLSGTPIQNSLKDIWSILSFLKLKPFNEREWWHRTIQRPVTTGNQEGLRRLQTLIKYITLRRTKTTKVNGKPVLELPERKVYIQYIKLSTEERNIYESMQNEGKAIIGRYFEEGSVLTHYADVLAVLVRLRQLCCHPYLVPNNFSSASTVSSTPEEMRVKLVNKIKLVLNSGSDEECSICLDSLNIPVITHCAHVFCKLCICQVIHSEKPNAKCPLCRSEIRLEHLLECPEEELDSSAKKDQKWVSSSKIDALMCALIEQREKDPHVKSIIVSQFTSYLSLIESALGESGFMFTRLDGSMTQKKRTKAIQSFQSTDVDSPTIMLLSLKAGGVGLNLTAASRVFLMDPAWNPAAEEQCFDRCHRLGQTKEVIITKFVVKDSVEENMLKIQDKKRELAAGAFGTNKPSSSEIKQARINEIRTLVNL
ncbi:helicase-like transcription factor isoform X2 [Hyla sarda]|uniref:helicase-like transcription factor isoform X2 n=1 Tax=Hyla sarda TaxID=327740 RepID=UPI0024C23212|nr:helicase-like transcription factor isoform X2 [Hyla sarda]